MQPKSHIYEQRRLEALRRYQILDTEPEEAYDNLARLAALICGSSIALVSFIDENRQWFKAKLGLDISEMPRNVGLSDLCLEEKDVVVIGDTLAQEQFARNAAVTGYPYMRFYAGVPLICPEGEVLGTICVIDQVPRELNQQQVEGLLALGEQVINQLELRRILAERQQVEEELKRQNLRSQLFAQITVRIRESLQLEEILQTTVTEVQKLLHADRVVIFRLAADGSGTVVQEAVLPGWPVTWRSNIVDPCFQEKYVEEYRQGRVRAIVDIEKAEIQDCYRQFLQQFGVKANLVVPILIREDIWGLLIAHQCTHPREWNRFETELLQQLGNQIGIALSQAQLLEQETRHSQELTRSNAELEQFAYVASHDLQEPLRMVTSYLQLLEQKYEHQLDSTAEQFINYAVDGALRMQTLINDLLNYSRVTTRGQAFVQVECETILTQAIANLKLAIEDNDAIITHDPLPVIKADRTQLTQVLQNLIGNAIKFRGKLSPRIHISAVRREVESARSQEVRREDKEKTIQGGDAEISPSARHSVVTTPHSLFPNPDEWLFSVTDNGIGLETQYAERIFVIFQRLHSRRKYPGTGIGLAICKKIVERHGGKIWVESEPGQGSIFYFTIPDGAEQK